ncbi:MAG: hypothetical protein C4538_05880 [Nitrospiraceae bacterium]|nr:MAG: hypothetical protein C4538_05880 [Nitrospiraceae bacterium]
MGILKKIFYLLPRLILFSIFGVYAVFALLSYFDYIERFLFPLHFIQGEVQKLDDNILLGPYPHFDELKKLQKETGINTVISLLNDSLPQEKALLNRERKIAERLGIDLYSYPMTYFNLNGTHNRRNAEEISALVRKINGSKIYIHCYLGRHRVNFVRDNLIKAGLGREVSAHN